MGTKFGKRQHVRNAREINGMQGGRQNAQKKRFSDVLNFFGGVVYQDRNDDRQSETIRKVRQNFCIFMSYAQAYKNYK
jgi:hypothetical protein